MECTRVVSHIYASGSGLLRPSRATNRVVVRVPAARRPQRLVVKTSAVASFAAPGSNSLGSSVQEAAPIIDIASGEAFQELLDTNTDKLVILMCKATGCRPCKSFRPKYGKLAAHYSDAIFCEVLGDRSESTRNLMRKLKIRATPTFVFFRNGEPIHTHSGINAEKMVAALKEAGLDNECNYASAVLSDGEK